MEPGVPFALLGAVVLLTVAAWVGLAATAVVRAGLQQGERGPAALLLLGGLGLGAVETATAADFGQVSSDVLAVLRAAGLVLVAGGLWAGALSGRRPVADLPACAPGVVVPLAAAPAPAALAALAAVAAAAAALRARRDLPGLLLAGGLLLVAAAAGVAPWADTEGGALAVVLLRGAGALALLAALVVLARSSVLGKVVAAILAGVLLMATAAVGVVGTVVARTADREQAELLSDAAQGRIELLQQALDSLADRAPFAASSCNSDGATCGAVFEALVPRIPTFAAVVPDVGTPIRLGGSAPLTQPEAVALAGHPVVEQALMGGANRVGSSGLPTRLRLVGNPPTLALVVAIPRRRPAPTAAAPSTFVFGIRLTDDYLARDFDDAGFGLSLLVDGEVVASNLSDNDRAVVERIAEQARVASGLPADGTTVAAEGTAPTVHFRPLEGLDGNPIGTLALSRDAENALGSQRDALQALLLTALVTTALVGGLALLLGRRTVDPLRRLTAAASRVAAGDLSVTTELSSSDEVGTLSRTFDAMTGSVAQLTGDLRASANRLQTVLSSMTDGLVATDGQGLVTNINRAALTMAGIDDPAGAIGFPLDTVIDVRVDGEPLPLDATDRPEVDAEVHPIDGDPVPVRVALAPLDVGEGVVLVLRDTTREREVERMKTEFLSNVSHELRTPLTPIRGYADLLANRPGLASEKVTTFAGTILAESLKMNRVVDLLVDVAAIEAGRVTVEPRPVSPGKLIDGRLEAWRARAPERAKDLKRRVAARLPAVQVDPTWLGKAIDELVDNAVKYTPPGTAITLTASLAPDGDRVRLAVWDAGPGIAAADQESLFLSFEQVDGSATRRVGGLGLGLSFVRRLAQDAGFPLSVHSEVGKGSEFALDLPVSDTPVPKRRRKKA